MRIPCETDRSWENGDNDGSCGICLRAVESSECPSNPNLNIGCTKDEVRIGQLCEADGNECGTRDSLDNCNSYDVYMRIPCETNPLPVDVKLTASDGAKHDQFGGSVAIDGDTLVVGAKLDTNDNGYESGSAYVYKRTGDRWIQESKLVASDGARRHYFRSSVSISGNTVIVGANGDDDNGKHSGSVYVYVRTATSWTRQAKYQSDDPGSAYIFNRTGSTWAQQAKLEASDPSGRDFFGVSVSVSDDLVVVGATGSDVAGDANEIIYVFSRTGTTWTQEAKLSRSDVVSGEDLGCSVAIDGDTVIVGAIHDDENGPSSGSAYVFDLDQL